MLLDSDDANQRDNLLELLSNHSIMTRPAWTLMNKLPMFRECPHMNFSQSEKNIVSRLINLPSSVFLASYLNNN